MNSTAKGINQINPMALSHAGLALDTALSHHHDAPFLPIADTTIIETGEAVLSDIRESEQRAAMKVSFGGFLAVQGVNVVRGPSLLAIPLAFKIANEAGDPAVVGVAAASVMAGTIVGGWCWGAGRTLNTGINHFPRTFKRAGQGMSDPQNLLELFPSLEIEEAPKNPIRRFGKSLHHGMGAYVCLTPQIYAAGLLGHSEQERRQLCKKLGLGAAAFMGTLVASATTSVALLEENHPGLAETISNDAQNTKLILMSLFGLAAVQIGRKRLPDKLAHGMLLASLSSKLAAKKSARHVKAQARRLELALSSG